jgi:hypothetical protein
MHTITLEKGLATFLNALTGKNRSAATLRAYQTDISQFISFLHANNVSIHTPAEVEKIDVMEEKGREHVCLPALRVPFFVAWDEAQHADGMDGSQRFLTTDPSSGFVRQARAFCIELVASFRSGRCLFQESMV